MTESDMWERLERLIREEIVKGWDFPLTVTPESQSGAAAHAILAALPEMIASDAAVERIDVAMTKEGRHLWPADIKRVILAAIRQEPTDD